MNEDWWGAFAVLEAGPDDCFTVIATLVAKLENPEWWLRGPWGPPVIKKI